MPTLELRMLRKIPKKYLEDRTYQCAELAGLEDLFRSGVPADAYHAEIRSESRYASSEDIKDRIAAMRPDLDLSCWSYRWMPDRSVRASVGGETVDLDKETIASLEAPHVSVRAYENLEQAWSIEVPCRDAAWLEKRLPCYLDARSVAALAEARLAYARKDALEDLDERSAEQSSMPGLFPDVFGFLCDAAAIASKRRLPVYACIVK